MPHLHPERIVAWVPTGKKKYTCGICYMKNIPFAFIAAHLKVDHNIVATGGGYAFYKEENETK